MRANRIILLLIALTLLPYQAVADESFANPEGGCVKFCNDKDYASAFKCYKGSRSRADAYLVTSHCALNNKDDKDAEEFALKSAKSRLQWVTWVNKLHIPKVKIRTGGTAESYMAAYIASDAGKKEEYKEKAVSYAMTSGQCIDIEEDEMRKKCGEQYFNSVVGRLSQRNTLTERNTLPQLAEKTCNGFSEYWSFLKGKCKCRKGYEDLKGVCTLDVYKNTRLTTESAVDLEELFNRMPLNSVDVFEVTLSNNGKVQLAIEKKAYGSPAYSEDGIEWEGDIKKITNRGFTDKVSSAWKWTENLNPVNWFHAKWKDDFEGQDKEVKWEIAKNVLEEFQDESEEPEIYEAQFVDYVNTALETKEGTEEFLEAIEDKELLEGLTDYSFDSLKGMLGDYFVEFPGKAIEKFAKELNTDDFFQAVYYYIRERESGKSPEAIPENQPEEMEFAVSVATLESFGQTAYWQKLEEAHQRYQAWKKLSKK